MKNSIHVHVNVKVQNHALFCNKAGDVQLADGVVAGNEFSYLELRLHENFGALYYAENRENFDLGCIYCLASSTIKGTG